MTAIVDRGGEFYRVADPSWGDPLDGSYAMRIGARWNAPGSFPVTYLSADLGTARANARRLLAKNLRGQPFTSHDLDPSELPVLVPAVVPRRAFLDAVTSEGIVGNGLPATYPVDETGAVVSWETCRLVGHHAWDDGTPGVACRSAAEHAPPAGEELAWFDRHEVELEARRARPFEQWYGLFDW